MAAGLQLQPPAVGDGWCAVATAGGHIGQAGEGIEGSNGAGRLADRGGHGPHLLAQLAEQLVFPLAGPGPQLEDAALPLLEIRGDEAFFVGQGLAPDPVVRHGGGLGFAHRQEVAEGAVVLQLQGADATALALLLLLVAEPGVLIVQLVAQPIQQRVDAVMDQVALGEGERWGLHQLVANRLGQLRQGWIGAEQLLQPLRPCADRRVQPSGELG